MICLIQSKKIDNIPIILFGKVFWDGMLKWMKESMLVGKSIDQEDLLSFIITDGVDETVSAIKDYIDKNEIKN